MNDEEKENLFDESYDFHAEEAYEDAKSECEHQHCCEHRPCEACYACLGLRREEFF